MSIVYSGSFLFRVVLKICFVCNFDFFFNNAVKGIQKGHHITLDKVIVGFLEQQRELQIFINDFLWVSGGIDGRISIKN